MVQKQRDLDSLAKALSLNIDYFNKLVQRQKNVLESIRLSYSNATDLAHNVTSLDVEMPSIIDFLPHLMGRSDLIQPQFKLSRNRFASIVIGVPTIKREKTSYLLETLKSLFDAMNDLEKSEALVVVMIAEVSKPA